MDNEYKPSDPKDKPFMRNLKQFQKKYVDESKVSQTISTRNETSIISSIIIDDDYDQDIRMSDESYDISRANSTSQFFEDDDEISFIEEI